MGEDDFLESQYEDRYTAIDEATEEDFDDEPDGYVVFEVDSRNFLTPCLSYERAEQACAALRDTGRYGELDVAPFWF